MSDQADSLRQLVRAQRQWREYALREQPVAVSRPRFPEPSRRDRGNGIGVLMARAARWAFARGGGRAE